LPIHEGHVLRGEGGHQHRGGHDSAQRQRGTRLPVGQRLISLSLRARKKQWGAFVRLNLPSRCDEGCGFKLAIKNT
jgi:hypothetical protein